MVLIAMIPSQCMEPFGLASRLPTYDPVDSTGLRQRKTEQWNGITPVCALIGGRYGEQVSRPQATREWDCRKSQRLGQCPGYANVGTMIWKEEV
jgi:hypothetical protein